MKKRKAISLMSGGLDSTLATKLILDQGIDVIGLFLDSPFGCKEDVEGVAAHLGISLKIVKKGKAYVDLVRNPKYGYGKNMNPCIDCRIYMFKIAQQVMEELGGDFIITGEVLGQRPMSQRKEAMALIDRDSQIEDLILRPLSAKYFPETRMEREGWVSREKLLKLSGRSRSEQLKWADQLNLKRYSPPAGGCLLTDSNFSARLSTFFDQTSNPTMDEVRLLRYGRHFDLSTGGHVVIGRNEGENKALWDTAAEAVKKGEMTFFRPDFSGPEAVLYGTQNPETYDEVGDLIAKYAKKGLMTEQKVEVICGGHIFNLTLQFPHASSIKTEEILPILN